jgi:hypothetical protein
VWARGHELVLSSCSLRAMAKHVCWHGEPHMPHRELQKGLVEKKKENIPLENGRGGGRGVKRTHSRTTVEHRTCDVMFDLMCDVVVEKNDLEFLRYGMERTGTAQISHAELCHCKQGRLSSYLRK